MIERMRESVMKGATRVNWIARFVAQRAKAETSVAKLMFESSKLEGRLGDLYRDLGKRVQELKDKGDTAVFEDSLVQEKLGEIKNLQDSVNEFRNQAHNLNKLPE